MSGVLAHVDRAAFATAFAGRLRARGVTVGLPAVESLTRALEVSAPDSPSRLYWLLRVCLVRRHDDLAVFDAVFSAVFDDAVLVTGRSAQPPPPRPSADDAHAAVPQGDDETTGGEGLPWVTLPPTVSTAEDSDADLTVPLRLPGELEALSLLPFEQLSLADLQVLGQWLERCVATWPTRRSRRRRPGPAGREVALRPTLARARRTGWEPVELVRVAPVLRRRRVVVLCDVSQSMQPQVTAYFHLMRALVLGLGGEAFAVGTSLTRVTPLLRHRSAVRAVEEATDRVTDRFGGTRLATSLTTLLASHHGGAVRGAVVVIASDGWDSEPPEQLAAVMARLRRRAHRVVWINPRASAPGYQPLVGTMAAALPFCDDLLPADDFRSLAAVLSQLGRSSARRRLSSRG